MAGPGTGADKTYKADESMIGSQFKCVVQGAADGGMKLPTATGQGKFLGVLLDYPASGQGGRVRHRDFATVIAGGVITRGDQLVVISGGAVVTWTASSQCVVGQAQQSAVLNDQFEMRVRDIPNDQIFPAS